MNKQEEFEKSIKENNLIVFKKLLNYSDIKFFGSFILAAKYGSFDIIKLLLKDERFDPSENRNQAIQQAVSRGYFNIVKLLLKDKRVDPSERENHSIRSASYNGYLNIVKLLLQDERVNPSADGNSAIYHSHLFKHSETTQLL